MARPKSGRGSFRRPGGNSEREERDYDQEIIAVDRVTRVMAGGKRMRFRVCVVIGKLQGHSVGLGVAKGTDVTGAVSKAVAQAKKHMVEVPLNRETIPYPLEIKYKGAHILLKPAPLGTGVKVGGSVRTILKLAKVPNVVGKILGSSNKISNARATVAAFHQLHRIPVPQAAEKPVAAGA